MEGIEGVGLARRVDDGVPDDGLRRWDPRRRGRRPRGENIDK